MKGQGAVARVTDPGTSWAAAAAAGLRAATVRARVFYVLTEVVKDVAAGVTHDELLGLYRATAGQLGWPPASDSSIRTRCNELWRAGKVEKVEGRAGRSRFGRDSLLWRAVIVQSSETVEDDDETGRLL